MTEVPGGHQAEPGSPPFPGATALSRLKVYESAATDGLAGGTPHCHTACTEAYYVIAGRGRVLTISGAGTAEVPLRPGVFCWFTPGTIHRLLNDSGDLEILVLMANAGLPEAGDMVLTFPDEVLADHERYHEAAGLPPDARTTSADDEAVQTRKNLAVEGLAELMTAGLEGLERFHRRAGALVAPRVSDWTSRWEAGALAAAHATGAQLAALAEGDVAHLMDSSVHQLPPAPAERRYGCCGTLGVMQPSATHVG